MAGRGFGGVGGRAGQVAGVTRDASDILRAMADTLARERMRRGQTGSYQAMPFDRPAEWATNEFAPNWPLDPQPLDAARPDTGQAAPRLTEFPISWNLQFNQRHVSWDTLYGASEMPLPRACIELRKTEISTLDWQFRVSPAAAARISKQAGRTKESVADEIRQKYQDEIDKVTDFWEVPDRKNGRNFAEWISIGMDEQLTHDALAIYPWMTYGGDLLGLWVLDGSTIKPLMDETGGRPATPYPAYQQVLYGYPRGEYRAQVIERDGQKQIPGALLASQLIYRRRVPRTRSMYGFGPTEQALLHGLLYNKRFEWMLAEYTTGSIPASFIESDGQLDWTPTQLLDYERYLNDRYAGQTEERMHFGLLPPGMKAALLATPGERYKPEYDLHLVKLVAMHYQTTITELGFTESGGLGSTGYHEGQEDIQFRKSRLPDLRWWASLITEISRTHLGLPREIEFSFLGLDEEDEAAADELDHNRLADGRMTLNQAVAKLGLPPLSFAEADKNMMQTQRGVVFLEGSSEQAPPGVLIEPASESNDVTGGSGSPTQRRPIKPVAKPATKMTAASPGWHADLDWSDIDWPTVDAEIAKAERWLESHPNPKRPFRFEHVDWDLAAHRCEPGMLMDDRVEFAKVADAAPKAPGQAGSETLNSSPYSDIDSLLYSARASTSKR